VHVTEGSGEAIIFEQAPIIASQKQSYKYLAKLENQMNDIFPSSVIPVEAPSALI
jgi:hypothetical protein